jgi:hypothetical protein
MPLGVIANDVPFGLDTLNQVWMGRGTLANEKKDAFQAN